MEWRNKQRIGEVSVEYFFIDFETTIVALLTLVSRQTINRILTALRERIVSLCEEESVFEQGCIEFDESYFGTKRVRGKRGCGASGKSITPAIKSRH